MNHMVEINLFIIFQPFPGNTNKCPMTVNMAGQWATRIALACISSTCQKTCTKISLVWQRARSKQFITMLVGQNLKVFLCGISRYRMAIYRDGSLLESLGTSCSLSSTPSSDQTDRTLCLVRSHNTTVCLELWWWETNLLNIIIQSKWCFQFEHHNITLHNSFWYIFPFYNMFYCTKSGLESSENLRRCSTIASTSDS